MTIIFFRLAFKQSWCALPTSSKESISDHLHYCAQKTSRAETQCLKIILKCLILQRFTSTQSKNIWIFATKFNLKIFIFWREIQIFEKLETQTKCEVKIQMRHFMWFSNSVLKKIEEDLYRKRYCFCIFFYIWRNEVYPKDKTQKLDAKEVFLESLETCWHWKKQRNLIFRVFRVLF